MKRHYKDIAIIIIIISFAYFNSLFNGFVGDDEVVISKNDFISSWSNLPRLFSKSYISNGVDLNYNVYRKMDYGSSEITYRPATTLNYMIVYSIGKLNPFPYHLNNVLLHIITVVLFYVLILFLSGNNVLALISSLFYGLHPINTEAVNGASFNENILSGMFFLSAFLLFLIYRNYRPVKKTALYLCSCFSFLLAALSKESAIVLPLIIILYDVYLKRNLGWKAFLFNFKFRYLGYAIVTIVYLWLYFYMFPSVDKMVMPFMGGSLFAHLLTSAKILARYLTEFFLPFSISVLPSFYAPIAISFDHQVLFSITLLILFLTLGFISYRYSKLFSFFIFWFFLTILPVSNIIPLPNMLAFRYMYLPAMGLSVVLAYGVLQLSGLKLIRKLSANSDKILILFIIALYSILTFFQNKHWKDEYTFNKNQIMYYPDMPQPYRLLAQYYSKKGFWKEAIESLNTAIKYDPYGPQSYLNLGYCYRELKMYDAAIDNFNKAIELKPDFTLAFYHLGVTYMEKKDYNKAMEVLNKAIELDPEYADAYNVLAITFINMGQDEKGRELFLKGLSADPENVTLKNNLNLQTSLSGVNKYKSDDLYIEK